MRGLFGFLSDERPATAPLAKVQRYYANGRAMKLAWLLDRDEFWVEYDGERCPKSASDGIVARVVVHDAAWDHLYWSDTDLLCVEAESGWLSPEGIWYGCKPVWHDVVAELVLHQPPDELGRTFARVRDRSYTSPPKATGRLTPQQAVWLRVSGFRVGDAGEFSKEELARWESKSGRPFKRERGSGD